MSSRESGSPTPEDKLTPEQKEFREYALAAVEIARSAGDILLQYQSKLQQVEWKDRHHFKTQADDASDAFIHEVIKRRYPDHNIFSEELPERETGHDISWVVDPLDGTIPYATGASDHFGVSIGILSGKDPRVGVINLPQRGRLYRAQAGLGAFVNDEPIRVSDLEDLRPAIIGIDYGKTERAQFLPAMNELLSREGVTYPVTYGSAASSLSLVAEGRLHAYCSSKLEPWDMAAGVVLIREAGGTVTTLDGKDWELGDQSILAANPRLHERLLSLLQR